MAQPQLAGFGHIDLTVRDGERSIRWWQEVMGFKTIATRDRPDFKLWTLMDPSGVVVSVMTHAESDGEPFDERRVGLDHLAFRVADRDALENWVRHLDVVCQIPASRTSSGGRSSSFATPTTFSSNCTRST
jgi:glyoxylase I family protein